MSRIDDLIAEHCPEGVEFLSLGELLDYSQPGKYLVKSTAYDTSFNTPVLTAGQTFILGYTNEVEGIYRASSYEPVVIFDDFTTAFKWVDFDFKAKSSAMKMLTPKPGVNLRYVWFAMQTISYSPQDHARQWIGTYSQFRIPVPPLEVQRAIVEVLDTFSKLEAELEAKLEAELEARKQQYEHYRNRSFEIIPQEDWVPISQLGAIERGSALQKKELVSDGVPAFHYGQVYTHYGPYAIQTKSFVSRTFASGKRVLLPGDVFIATTSENEEDLGKAVAWLGDTPAVASSDAYIFRPEADARYISYFFGSRHFQDQKKRFITGTKVKRISGDAIGKIRIPRPTSAQQSEIADQLDKFDALVNDLSVGLPAELAARRQQYEYYRDKLLTFKELEVTA